MNPTLNAEEWMRILEKVAAALPPQGPPVKLCLIGSAACLFGGMDGRTSVDLDVWRPHSDYDRSELRIAAEAAGIFFDPKGTLDPTRPYLQIVEPGLAQLGAFDPVLVDRMGRLEIYRPPAENLIAAKLIRAIVQHPLLWRLRPAGYRRVTLPGFPYYIAFVTDEQQALVIAVAHSSRNPDYLSRRIR